MAQNKLYVGNFPYTCDEAQIRTIFEAQGEIEELAMIMDRETGRPRGFCFITYVSAEAAEKALTLDGQDLDGRPLKVNVANDRDGGGRR